MPPKRKKPIAQKPSGGANHTENLEAEGREISFAISLYQKGKIGDAANHLEEAARRADPPVAVKLLLTAAQLVDSKNPIRARNLLTEALSIDPNCGVAHLGLSVTLNNLGQFKSSIQHLRDAVLLPLTPGQKILASLMLTKYGLLSSALEMSKSAFYEAGRPLHQASNCLDIALQVADWDFAEELIKILREAHKSGLTKECNEAAKTHILWCDEERINIEVIKAWSERTYPSFTTQKKKIVQNPSGRPLRIGYLSSDFRNHPTALLINGLFRHHDKSKFDLHLYCSGWDDGSEIRKEIFSHFEKIYHVAELDDQDASELISSHNLDILVELNGPTKSNRMGILSYRPAPIQICYLGWPGSAGGRFVDYIIADEYILPEENAGLYPEKIIWLGGSYQINDYDSLGLPPAPSKKTYGFKADTVVVGMFNTINKARREVWNAWMEIIKSCPRSVFWILDPGPDARENLAKEAIRAGVGLDRIIIAPRVPQSTHLERLQVCDLILDPWPIGGHTSTADALFAGVPVIAMEGHSYASRVSGGLLHSVGLDDFVAKNDRHYVEIGKYLLSAGQPLFEAKGLVTDLLRKSDLFKSSKTTNDIEQAFLHLAIESFEG